MIALGACGAQEIRETQRPFRGFLPSETTLRGLYQATVFANRFSASAAIGQLGYLNGTWRRMTSGFAQILNARKALRNVKQKLYLPEGNVQTRSTPAGAVNLLISSLEARHGRARALLSRTRAGDIKSDSDEA
jgi:hypothetical protein